MKNWPNDSFLPPSLFLPTPGTFDVQLIIARDEMSGKNIQQEKRKCATSLFRRACLPISPFFVGLLPNVFSCHRPPGPPFPPQSLELRLHPHSHPKAGLGRVNAAPRWEVLPICLRSVSGGGGRAVSRHFSWTGFCTLQACSLPKARRKERSRELGTPCLTAPCPHTLAPWRLGAQWSRRVSWLKAVSLSSPPSRAHTFWMRARIVPFGK